MDDVLDNAMNIGDTYYEVSEDKGWDTMTQQLREFYLSPDEAAWVEAQKLPYSIKNEFIYESSFSSPSRDCTLPLPTKTKVFEAKRVIPSIHGRSIRLKVSYCETYGIFEWFLSTSERKVNE